MMTAKNAAKALVKARVLARQAMSNWRLADMKPGTASARIAQDRGDRQNTKADSLFDQVAQFLEGK